MDNEKGEIVEQELNELVGHTVAVEVRVPNSYLEVHLYGRLDHLSGALYVLSVDGDKHSTVMFHTANVVKIVRHASQKVFILLKGVGMSEREAHDEWLASWS